jgi:glycosyltransferase involved in cell wall biosynthesis
MVCYYFPPREGIASLRAERFAAHLPSFGWEPTVLSPRLSDYGEPTSGPTSPLVLRTATLEISRVGRLAAGLTLDPETPATVHGWRRQLRDVARRWAYFPDAQIGWYPFAVRQALRLLRRVQFDAVFSSSVPLTAHLVAQAVAKRAGLPWIAEFRDFWTDTMERDHPHLVRHRSLERTWLDSASGVVTVSPSLAREYEGKGARRVWLITNGFEPEEMPAPLKTDQFVLTYLGAFYPQWQDLSSVWSALRRMRTADALPTLRIRFIGDMPSIIANQLRVAGLSDIVEVTGRRPHQEALALMSSSSLLLLAGPRGGRPELRGMLAAKTFEYLASGLPILQVADPESDAARFLADHPGCVTVSPADAEGLVRALVALRAGGRFERDLSPYTRRALTERLSAALDEVSRPTLG